MKQKGFTLIELLVTMGIIAVLTGLSIFNFNQSRVRARDVQRKSDMGQLMKALELYKNDKLEYPQVTGVDDTIFQQALLTGEYIKEDFKDPKGGTDWIKYKYINLTPSKTTYAIVACLENKADTAKANNDFGMCTKFYATGTCTCGLGASPATWTGTMYIVSNE